MKNQALHVLQCNNARLKTAADYIEWSINGYRMIESIIESDFGEMDEDSRLVFETKLAFLEEAERRLVRAQHCMHKFLKQYINQKSGS